MASGNFTGSSPAHAGRIVLLALWLSSVSGFSQEDLTRYVNPFIGTREMGHTFPGACVPFGFVQLSPDTDTLPYEKDGKYNPGVYRYCAGYQYDDPTIVGFSHTHFNGTGHSDLGDFLVMPQVGKLRMNPGTSDNPSGGYQSAYRKETESAAPGYYSVFLDGPGVKAELTASTRSAMHRYTFPASDSARILLDLIHGIYNYDGKVLWSHVTVHNDTLVTGYRITSGWARTRYLYFAMVFSKPFRQYGIINDERPVYRGFWRKFNQVENFPEGGGHRIRAHFDFNTRQGEQVMIRVGLSAVGCEGALANLQAEIPGWDFDRVKAAARDAWERELGRIRIEADEERKINFYTALYHTLLSPVLYQDVDGRYRGIDHEIHRAEGFTNYTIFSLWDTYRAEHPLLTWLWPDRTRDMVRSLLAHFEQSPQKMLPVWSHHGNENWCMIGYHSVPVIADAWIKGVRGFNPSQALRACVTTATNPLYEGVPDYMDLGYVPDERSANSASLTLEYAYDDFALACFARSVAGETDLTESDRAFASRQERLFMARSKNYRNLFDSTSGFIRPKSKEGRWKSPFDPLSTHGQGFIEGNAWNYSLYVPHDIPDLIRMAGGDRPFIRRLDSLFSMHLDDKYFAETEDVTRSGLMGNYVHGNEPSHHVAYLYNWTSSPWKTQERIHRITGTLYRNAPDGLCGNDDCGQMSAWYVFSLLGFYPVCPGTDEYALGSPGIRSASIRLPGGNVLNIRAAGLDEKNIYVRSATLNGQLISRPFIHHPALMQGGELIFRMASRP